MGSERWGRELMIAPGPDGCRYALLALEGGGFGISCDGVRDERYLWPAGALPQAVETFVKLTDLAPPRE